MPLRAAIAITVFFSLGIIAFAVVAQTEAEARNHDLVYGSEAQYRIPALETLQAGGPEAQAIINALSVEATGTPLLTPENSPVFDYESLWEAPLHIDPIYYPLPHETR